MVPARGGRSGKGAYVYTDVRSLRLAAWLWSQQGRLFTMRRDGQWWVFTFANDGRWLHRLMNRWFKGGQQVTPRQQKAFDERLHELRETIAEAQRLGAVGFDRRAWMWYFPDGHRTSRSEGTGQ